MTSLPLSIIVVSRHRAEALKRCMKALMQQDHTALEIIVVADPAGLAAVTDMPVQIKRVPFDEDNISQARNLGLVHAGGAVAAFIDDDAVAEPTWASRLCAPFANARVVAATGFVRGRNGISFQWKAEEVDCDGVDHAVAVDPKAITLRTGTSARAVKTQGTNCAFRTDALRAIGGFDPAFRFFLDEADVNLRMADHCRTAQGLTAIVPLAQVHHGYLASARRRADRVPVSLHEIAASTAVFLRRHAPEHLDAGQERAMQSERRRALHHMVAGRIEPRDVGRLMRTFADGWADGMQRPLESPLPMTAAPPPFAGIPDLWRRGGCILFGRQRDLGRLRQDARTASGEGKIVTVLCLSAGWRRHRHWFDDEGYWVQVGGLWGRSDRALLPKQGATVSERALSEAHRLAEFRPIQA